MNLSGLDQNGHEIVLDDLLVNDYTLLYFAPRGLPKATCNCSGGKSPALPNLQTLQELGCQVVGVGYDAPQQNVEWMRPRGFSFPYLTITPETAAEWGLRKNPDEPWQSRPRRVAVLLDRSGDEITRFKIHDPTTNLSEVIAYLRQTSGKPRGKFARFFR